MTAEGAYPKVDGDILYASEANLNARSTEVASGQTISVSAGSGTAIGAWTWTSTGSTGVVTDGDFTTVWAGSWQGPTNQTGSVVLPLLYESYKNAVLFTGSLGEEGFSVGGDFNIYAKDNNGSSSTVYSHTGILSGFDLGSYMPITSRFKTSEIIFETSALGQAGSIAIKLIDIKVI